MTNIARELTDHVFFHTTGLSADNTVLLTQRALHGADGGELFMEHSLGNTLQWFDGKLRVNEPALSEGYSLRYVADETPGFAYGNSFTEQGLKSVARGARQVRSYRPPTGGLSLSVPVNHHRLYTAENPLDDVAEHERIRILQDLDQKIRSVDSAITQVALTMQTEYQMVTIIRQDGQRLDDVRPMTSFRVSVTMEKDGKKKQGTANYAARGTLTDFFKTVGADVLATRAVAQARSNLEAIPCPAGQMDVILGSGAAAVMLHEAVGHGLEGDANRLNASAFAGLIGQQVASPDVTVIDQGNIAGQRGALMFDDEGVQTGQTVLIEKGILKTYMQDTINARLMKMPVTGNGRRESYYHLPIPRMTTTFMRAGNYTKEEIFDSVRDRALYVVQFGGGQVKTAKGEFVFAAHEGYLVEKGRIVAPVQGATLVGNCIEAMKSIDMIGNDLVVDNGTWMCGKDGQSVPVGVGQSHLKMRGMTVGGTN